MVETSKHRSGKLLIRALDAEKHVIKLEKWAVPVTNKDEIKDRVLTENTAQGILNHLRELESNRARTQRRWIWELLQNARDAAAEDDTNLVASIELDDSELVFQHSGRGFTMEEVAHLIYHGSTKQEDEKTIGQYGSGFLTTHLLSPEIGVSGQLADGRSFNFQLKREIVSANALSDSMDRAWDEFHASIDTVADNCTNQFRYPVAEESMDAVDNGIETLKQCAPFVVVFNRQFRCINIKSPEETITFEVIERATLQEGLQAVTVGVSECGSLRERKFLLVEGRLASVTTSMTPTDNGAVCLPLDGIPKLFLGFPLVGTEAFSFPAVVNSFAFTPTENRDGVYLGQSDDEVNCTNQAVMEEACDLHVKLVEFVTELQWASAHTLAVIPPISKQNWLSEEWLHDRLGQLVSQIRQTPAVLNGDSALLPKDSVVPLVGECTSTEALWDLLSQVKNFQRKLPIRYEANGWREAVESWAPITSCDVTSFDEGYDGSKLVSYIEEVTKMADAEYGIIERLEDVLQDDCDAVQWLDSLYQFLKDDGAENIIREHNIVLDQAGCLDKLSNLYRDDSICEELKAIGDDVLDVGIRGRLRDTRLTSLADEIGKGEYGNKELIQETTDRLKELGDDETLGDEFIQASPLVLTWLVANKQWNYLMNYPAFSTRPNDDTSNVLWIGQKGREDTDVPLAPIKAWTEDLQQYADLFPWRYIMAEKFFDVMRETDVWQMLSEQGYVRTDVLVHDSRILEAFLPDEPLSEVEHKSVDAVPVTDIFLLTKRRDGVMERVRDSQDRARLFWRFLTEWLITRDPDGLEPKTTKCVCGVSHRYYPAMWLVPVVRNRWVPQGSDIRDRVTAQSLANLLRDSGWSPSALGDDSGALKLLKAVRVFPFDLMKHFLVGDEASQAVLDQTMTNILVSTDGDLSQVRDFVEDMKTDKDLPQHLAARRERRRVVHENQRMGGLVENLVKEVLENEGFSVRRTGVGSDFEIEFDMLEEDYVMDIELTRNDRTWLVEVKATREHGVRMTAKQADTAVKMMSGFLLCVVPVTQSDTDVTKDDVRANMRFVQNIGSRVAPLCAELDALNELRDEAVTPSDEDIKLEIEAGTAHVRVDRTVWQSGCCLAELSDRLK